MNILLLGSGGREHALAWQIKQSKHCDHLFIAPGNAGTAECGVNVAIDISDFAGIRKLVMEEDIHLVVVGPEEPLVKGVHDFFLADPILHKIPVIGPVQAGAALEGSKDFAKAFMKRHGIPTAAYQTFDKTQISQAKKYLRTLSPPYVLKADGLAAGKGVVIPSTLEEADKELDEMLVQSRFGVAGSKVVIEEFLKGIELSVFVLTDGKSYKLLPSAKDYKRIGDGDTGLNTGGMGAVSPVPFADEKFLKNVEERIVIPTVNGLIAEGIDYKGFLFIGLMNVNGDPFVIEYNVRLGDPETEVVLPRIQTDLVELFFATGKGKLSTIDLKIDPRTAVTVMMVSGGYPGDYQKGKIIQGIENVQDSLVFHAGTVKKDHDIISAGGRVLAITSFGENISEAREKSYKNLSKISFDGAYNRKDIGMDLISD
ncbi:MAG TPA: phosphoribosylamine--glycine ligase [Bacteroidia bacterium]|nr:phosphoribosylamine--glycine ligase [Bacteroidia bacterium]